MRVHIRVHHFYSQDLAPDPEGGRIHVNRGRQRSPRFHDSKNAGPWSGPTTIRRPPTPTSFHLKSLLQEILRQQKK